MLLVLVPGLAQAQIQASIQPRVEVRADDPVGVVDPYGRVFQAAFEATVICAASQSADPEYEVRFRVNNASHAAIQVSFDQPSWNFTFDRQDCLEDSQAARQSQDFNATARVGEPLQAFVAWWVELAADLYSAGVLLDTGTDPLNLTVGFAFGLRINGTHARVTGSHDVAYTIEVENTGNADTWVHASAHGSPGVSVDTPVVTFEVPFGGRTSFQVNATADDCREPTNAVRVSLSGRAIVNAEPSQGSVETDLTGFPCTGRSQAIFLFLTVSVVVLGVIILAGVGGWLLVRRR